MLEKAKKTWTSLNKNIVVNQRELVLGLAVCALAGIVIGTFLSPNVYVNVSNNGNGTLPNGEEAEAAEENGG